MADFDFSRAFQPGKRSDPRTFQIALALVALGDAVRLTALGQLSGPAWFVVLVLLAFALSNRLRDAGRATVLAILPIGVAILAKTVGAVIAFTAALYPDFLAFLERRGVDLNDPAAMQAAAWDSEIQAAYESHLQNSPELLASLMTAGDWPSTWAFWLVIAVFAFYWSRWPSRPYAIRGGRG
ncbi:MAG: hypothetical protein ACFE0P_13975 [Oceanicaulis sp.]